MLIDNTKQNNVVIGIQNLKPGVYKTDRGTIVLVSSDDPNRYTHFKPMGTVTSDNRIIGCVLVSDDGNISLPLQIKGGYDWFTTRFTRVGDTWDITVPGKNG